MALWRQVQAQGKGGGAKFNKIKKQVEVEKAQGRALRKQADLIEFKNRLQKEGLLPKSAKSDKSDDLRAIFEKAISIGKKKVPERPEFTPLPTDIKNQLAALGAPPKTTPSERYRRRVAEAEEAAKKGEKPAPVEGRKIEKSPEAARIKPPASPTKGNTDLILDDISRMMRGESPLNIEVASAPGELGMKGRMKQPETSASGSATGNTRWARLDAKDHDDGLGKVRREGDTKYDGWKDSYGSGARKIGEGAYGTVMRNPDGTFVKRGDIADTEAALIKRLGEKDLGPKLVAADINGPARYHQENFVDVKNGRIAMGEVPGQPMGGMAMAFTKFGDKNAADIYWKAMADLHRMGIAHNDAHIDNILIDDKGKGRWVDLGLAQASPKAALAEAFGVFKPLKGGDEVTVPGSATGNGNWQTERWTGTGVREANRMAREGKWKEFQERFPVAAKVWDNQPSAIKKLENFGLDTNEINSIIAHGIRSPLSSYDQSDGFSRITDKQAQEVLNTLYDGI